MNNVVPSVAAVANTSSAAIQTPLEKLKAAVVLLKNKSVTTSDQRFSQALKNIQSSLQGASGGIDDGLPDITITETNGKLMIKAPATAYSKGFLADHTEAILRKLLQLMASKVTVNHEGFIAHIMPIITGVIATRLLDEAVETVTEDGRETQVRLAASQSNSNTDDTAILRGRGADDTAIEGVRRTQRSIPTAQASAGSGSSESVSLRTTEQTDSLVKLGVKNLDGSDGAYRALTQQISDSFTQNSNSFTQAWQIYSTRLSSDLGTPKATETLEKLINIFFWCNSKRDKRLSFDDVTKELTGSLRQFIWNTYEQDFSRCEQTLAAIIAAIETIPDENLSAEVKNLHEGSTLINQAIKDQVKNIRFRTESKPKASSASVPILASMQVLREARGDTAQAAELRSTGGLVRTARSTSKNQDQSIEIERFPINEDFTTYLFTNSESGYKSIYAIVEQISRAIKTAQSETVDPFAGNIPSVLIEELNKAASREALKKESPDAPEVAPYKFNEMAQYLQYLSNVLNSDNYLIERCGREAPAAYALPYILLNYYKNDTTHRITYNAILEELGKKYTTFKGMSETVANLERRVRNETEDAARKATEQRIEQQIQFINSKRQEAKSTLIKAILSKSDARDQLLQDMGLVNKVSFAQPNTEGFLIRLAEIKLNDPEYGLMLNHDKDFTSEILFYLLTGNILLSPITVNNPDVFDLSKGTIEKLTQKELNTRYDNARRAIAKDFSDDSLNNKSSILSLVSRLKGKASMSQDTVDYAASIGKPSFKLLENLADFLKSGTGWERNKYGAIFNTINQQVTSSGFVPLLRDFAASSNLNRVFAAKLDEQNQRQKHIIEVLRKMWQTIPSIMKSGDTGEISHALNQLGA